MENVISKATFFGVAFDGGLSKHLGFRVLVVVVFTTAGTFPLPAHYQKKGETFDSANLAKALMKALTDAHIALEKIKVYIADGNKGLYCPLSNFPRRSHTSSAPQSAKPK